MLKRLYLLSGLATLAVVVNHAAGWGFTALFWWVHRYRPVTPPNYDQVGSLGYYGLLLAKQLTVFSVPAFLILSGMFVAYANAETAKGRAWERLRARLGYLLIPYLVWSGASFALDAMQRVVYTPAAYLSRLILGEPTGSYYYVIALCQLYLLTPILVPLASQRPRLVLAGAAVLQLAVTAADYLILAPAPLTLGGLNLALLPASLIIRWIFFFAVGLVCGLHRLRVQSWLSRNKRPLLAAVITCLCLGLIEAEVVFRMTGRDWSGGITLPTTGYALSLVLLCLSLDQFTLPRSQWWMRLGSRSYGVYLLHPLVLAVAAKVVFHLAPWMLSAQALYQPFLIGLALALPLLLMALVARTPVRRWYRFLFG